MSIDETIETIQLAIAQVEWEYPMDYDLNTNMAWYDEDGEIAADSEEKIKAITDLVNGVPPCAPKQNAGK